VVGTFRDVESGTEIVGSAVIVVGRGTGATEEEASCGWACGAAAARLARSSVTAERMAGGGMSD
jgi:hypothetical protein